MVQVNGEGTAYRGKSVFAPDTLIGNDGSSGVFLDSGNDNQVSQVLPVKNPVTILVQDAPAPFLPNPYGYAVGVGGAGRRAARRAKRAAKKSGASNKEARAAKKSTKAEYAEEGSRRQEVLQRRAEKLTIKATTKFGSNERKSQMKDFRKERREQIKENAKQFVMKSIMAIPRGAALALLKLNYRGMATKVSFATPQEQEKIKKKWEGLGGNFNTFWDAAQSSKGKRPFVCAKKCKSKLANDIESRGLETVKKEVADKALGQEEYLNAVETVAIAGMVAAGATVISTILGLVANNLNAKSVDKQLEYEQNLADQEDAMMSDLEKKKADLAFKMMQEDPRQSILNDPNLSEEEKKAALEYLDSQIGGVNWVKVALIGLGAIAGLTLLYFTVDYLTSSKKQP